MAGAINFRQKWEHKLSGYKFVWHLAVGKDFFQKDRIWKAARRIVDKSMPGYIQIKAILSNVKRAPMIKALSGDTKRPRNKDMINRVKAVKGLV